MSICKQCNKTKSVIHKGICVNCYGYNHRRNRQDQAPKKKCECGCGELIPSINLKGRSQRFKNNSHRKRENSSQWKGGRYKSRGYWMILMPEYFSADKDGYVREHIYNYQEYHKCCMLSWGEVHHIDPVREDYCNNMPWNLQGMIGRQHHKIHSSKDMTDRKCSICGSNTTYVNKKGHQEWRIYNNRLTCSRCKFKIWWKYKGK